MPPNFVPSGHPNPIKEKGYVISENGFARRSARPKLKRHVPPSACLPCLPIGALGRADREEMH